VKRLALFAVASGVGIAALALLFGALYSEPDAHRAIRVSAFVAYGVQLFAFMVMLAMRGTNVFAAWGLGMLLRFVALAVVAFGLVKIMVLPATPALLSLVAFFFVTTLVEPVLLKR
jgi:hypothetical protein